jgi:hypothetical protein
MGVESGPSVEPTYSRVNPSQRYLELISLYGALHRDGDSAHGIQPERMFDGRSLLARAFDIQSLVKRHGARTVLDYGSGKGRQYLPKSVTDANGKQYASIPKLWNATVTCYDPAFTPFSTLPNARFDGVISTDVLEHCPEADLPWIVDEMYGFAGKFLFANIACYPAEKRLPNGENAHCTIRPPEWWDALLRETAKRHRHVRWYAAVEQLVPGSDGRATMAQSLLSG